MLWEVGQISMYLLLVKISRAVMLALAWPCLPEEVERKHHRASRAMGNNSEQEHTCALPQGAGNAGEPHTTRKVVAQQCGSHRPATVPGVIADWPRNDHIPVLEVVTSTTLQGWPLMITWEPFFTSPARMG